MVAAVRVALRGRGRAPATATAAATTTAHPTSTGKVGRVRTALDRSCAAAGWPRLGGRLLLLLLLWRLLWRRTVSADAVQGGKCVAVRVHHRKCVCNLLATRLFPATIVHCTRGVHLYGPAVNGPKSEYADVFGPLVPSHPEGPHDRVHAGQGSVLGMKHQFC